MDLNLSKKRVFITGSTHGIGLEIAKTFLKEGALVIVNGRNSTRWENLSEEFKSQVTFIAGDVSKTEDAKRISMDINEKFSGLDILVCNAGNGRSVPPGEETHLEWKRLLEANLFTATTIIEHTRNMLKMSKGNIICISSICGISALGAPLAYSASKAALNSYVIGLSKVYGKYGVRVNAIAPGNILFDDSVWERKLKENKDSVEEMLESRVALKRLGKAEDIANMTCYLSSDNAGFITGSIMVVDGGQIE